MHHSTPIVKNLVLVGGGHAHALVIRMWAMNPLTGVRLTLVSPDWQTPYSGMLPGLLAGHYDSHDIHIDLRRVCSWAGVRFIEDHVISISPQSNNLKLKAHPDIEYDTLSIDIGSTPDMRLPGLKQYAQAVKPINLFYPRFLNCIKRCRLATANHTPTKKDQSLFQIVIVGGGAGGIEVALAMAENLSDISAHISIILAVRGDKILESYPQKIAQAAIKTLDKMNVRLVTDFDVIRVEEQKIVASNDQVIHADEIFFCTQALAADWPKASGLECDLRGFIKVNSFLQSVNHSNIFAAGDIASMQETPRPKAGVYAVRQSPILYENLTHHLLGKLLQPYTPQDGFLSLLSLGKKKALAAKNTLSISSPLLQSTLWQWKNAIDVKFMNQFKYLPDINMNASLEVNPLLVRNSEQNQIKNYRIRCAGCGGKVGSSLLRKVLSEVSGNEKFTPEDAAIFSTPQKTLIQTVDQITSPIDNPYLFGKIAALHALSDIFAMNANPINVQILLNLPYAASNIQAQEMTQVMRGVLEILKQHGCKLIGGHTAEAKELSLGFVVNAVPYQDKVLFEKCNLKLNDTLVITKPLGTGVILAAQMQHQSRGNWYNAALSSMLESNQAAATLFSKLGVTACTDVTGFGLAGHLSEMLEASLCQATVNLSDIPLLQGASILSESGIRSSLYPQNSELIKSLSISKETSQHPGFPLLFDPQTSGGLLAGLSEQALKKLKSQKTIDFDIIGKVNTLNTSQSIEPLLFNL